MGSPSSYRPIAILPALSKVLEKLVLSQLMPFLDPKLPSSQFGFRPGRGTSDAIATAHSSWTKAVSAGKVTGIAAFDLTAAFDTVDHNILCGKLEALGLSPSATKWFHDYLIGRSQRVRFNGELSSPSMIRCGVPQGSLLGPVLFLVIIWDLPQILGFNPLPSHMDGMVGYADDILVWASGKNTGDVTQKLERLSTSIATYMHHNCLTLNPEKTQILWAGSGRCPPDVLVNGVKVKPVAAPKLFGHQVRLSLETQPTLRQLMWFNVCHSWTCPQTPTSHSPRICRRSGQGTGTWEARTWCDHDYFTPSCGLRPLSGTPDCYPNTSQWHCKGCLLCPQGPTLPNPTTPLCCRPTLGQPDGCPTVCNGSLEVAKTAGQPSKQPPPFPLRTSRPECDKNQGCRNKTSSNKISNGILCLDGHEDLELQSGSQTGTLLGEGRKGLQPPSLMLLPFEF